MSISRKLFTLAKSPLGGLIVGISFGNFSRLLPVERVRETKTVLAFKHPKPSWENHILIVPKKAIKDLAAVTDVEMSYIADSLQVARDIAKENKWSETDYMLVTNGGSRQEVSQLHFHLTSGSAL